MNSLCNSFCSRIRTTIFAGAICTTFGVMAIVTASVLGAPPPPPPHPTAPPPAPPAPATPPASQPATHPSTVPANLPQSKEIVEASLQAIGGKDAAQKIHNLSLNATLAAPIGDVKFQLKSSDDGSFHLTQGIANQEGTESTVAYNGKVGWMHSAQTGYRIVEGSMLEQGMEQFSLLFPFWSVLHPEAKYTKMETVDQTKFADQDCYKVRLTEGENDEMQRFAFYDVKDKMIRGMQVVQESPMGSMQVDFQFSEWKEFGDIKMFTKMIIDQMGQQLTISYDDLAFNKVEPAAFEPPAEVKELLNKPASQPSTQPESGPATTAPSSPNRD